MCYYRSHYVYRYLTHHPWWQNVYAASTARVVSCEREGPPPHDCQCQSLLRRGDRGTAVGAAPQRGPGAPCDSPGRDRVETRVVLWGGMDRVPHRTPLGDRTGARHDPRRATGAVASDGPRHRSRLSPLDRKSVV